MHKSGENILRVKYIKQFFYFRGECFQLNKIWILKMKTK